MHGEFLSNLKIEKTKYPHVNNVKSAINLGNTSDIILFVDEFKL